MNYYKLKIIFALLLVITLLVFSISNYIESYYLKRILAVISIVTSLGILKYYQTSKIM